MLAYLLVLLRGQNTLQIKVAICRDHAVVDTYNLDGDTYDTIFAS